MPTKNMVIDHSSMLCLKHFNPADVALFNNLLDDNKKVNVLGKCLTPLVRDGACPLFFPKETDIGMNELQVCSDFMENNATIDNKLSICGFGNS